MSTSKPMSANDGGDHLGAAVVAVLAHLDHEHPGSAALGLGEGVDVALQLGELLVALVGRAVHAGDRTDLAPCGARTRSSMASEISPRRGPGPGRVDGEGEQVAVAACAFGERVERGLAGLAVAFGPDLVELGDLAVADHGVVDVEDVDELDVVGHVLVHADDDVLAAVDAGLLARRPTPRCAASACRVATALVMPPSSSTSPMRVQASSTRSTG